MFRTLKNSHNVEDLRLLAKQRLPGPIFHYIDGAADDETTYRRNTAAYADCDLVPNVLAGVQDVDMSVTVMGQKLAMPVFCSPTALQRLFHHDGERAVARAAEKFGTMFGVSALGSVKLAELKDYVDQGSNVAVSIGDYFGSMLDQSMNWDDAAALREKWGGPFCLKGIMSVADARKAVEIGADAIMVSNHGGRQLDGSRSPFDQIAEIADAVGNDIDIICDGGIRRGTHVIKALAAGAKACSGGRMYLYALAAAGQPGVEKALGNMQREIERDMKLMGVTRIDQLNREMLRYR